MDSLSEKDKSTLETNKTGSNLDIEELVEAVRGKRNTCLENQWGFEFRGRSVNLRYQADKIISWLAKFEEVGDIATQHDLVTQHYHGLGFDSCFRYALLTFFGIGC